MGTNPLTDHPGAAKAGAPLSVELARALQHLRAKGIPEEVKRSVRLHIADAIGIGIAARSSELAGCVTSAQHALSGPGPCSLLGGGAAAPASAAFINASLIHILDYDDIHDQGRLHPGPVALPAAMAALETTGMTAAAADKALIEAVALSTELMCRLGLAWSPKGQGAGADWFLTQLFGYVAAAVAAAGVLGLDEDRVVSAIGLAYMQAAGGKQAGFGTGATARAIYPAFAAQGGLQAALLAQAGLTGPEGALDGDAGLFPVYFGGHLGQAQRAALLDFGHWHCLDVDFKPWPCCRLSHPYVAVALAARERLRGSECRRVIAEVNASAARLCRPLDQRRRPATLQDAKYSIPFMTAFALVRGAPTLDNLNESVLHDQAILDMAQRIEVEEALADNAGHPAAVLHVEQAGEPPSRHAFEAADLHMDQAAVKSKFVQCLRYADRAGDAETIWLAIMEGRIMDAVR